MDSCEEYPLHSLVSSDHFYEDIEEELEDPNEKDDMGYTLLHIAAQSVEDNRRILQLLLDKGADLESTTPHGHTPLHLAMSSRKRDAVAALLQAGSSVNCKDFFGWTALHFAVSKTLSYPQNPDSDTSCDVWILEKLLSHPKIHLSAVDRVGDTPLMWAVKERNSEVVRELLKRGTNPNVANEQNRTPLHEALHAKSQNHEIVFSLLTNGAGIYCADNSGQTPLDILVQGFRGDETSAYSSAAVSLAFEARCLSLIALRYHVKQSLHQKLEKTPVLSNHLYECCREVRMMKGLLIYKKVTLHDFALDCFQNQGGDPVQDVYIPVVEVLLSGVCRQYFELVLSRISSQNMRSVLEKTAKASSLDLVSSDASNFTILYRIRRFYDEDIALNSRLKRLKALKC